MVDRTVARRYAQAFIELGEENGSIESLSRDLHRILDLLRSHDGALLEVLSTPVFTIEERRSALDAVLPRVAPDPLTRNLLHLLLDNGRFGTLETVVEFFDAFADQRANRVRVSVQTAEPLTPQLEAEVRTSLESITGKEVILQPQVDPGLIGGLVAKVGDVVYDASVKTRLKDIRQRLLSSRVSAEA